MREILGRGPVRVCVEHGSSGSWVTVLSILLLPLDYCDVQT